MPGFQIYVETITMVLLRDFELLKTGVLLSDSTGDPKPQLSYDSCACPGPWNIPQLRAHSLDLEQKMVPSAIL